MRCKEIVWVDLFARFESGEARSYCKADFPILLSDPDDYLHRPSPNSYGVISGKTSGKRAALRTSYNKLSRIYVRVMPKRFGCQRCLSRG